MNNDLEIILKDILLSISNMDDMNSKPGAKYDPYYPISDVVNINQKILNRILELELKVEKLEKEINNKKENII